MNITAKYSTAPPDRRREKRSRVLGVVKLLFGGFSKTVFDCTTINRSRHGLRVQVGSTHVIPNELIVEFSNGTRRHARLAWASCAEVGLEYETEAL
jgi:hypothetical protein